MLCSFRWGPGEIAGKKHTKVPLKYPNSLLAADTRYQKPCWTRNRFLDSPSFPAAARCCNLSFSGRRVFLRFLDRLQPLALLIMRLALGAIMVVHGYHNVFGGLHHHAQMVAGLGLPHWLGYVSSFTEFLGGLLILAGLFTRVAALAVCVDLVVALWKVHLHNGLIGSTDHPGYEFPLAAAALAFGLIFLGGGPIALDHALRGGGGGAPKR